MQSIEGVVLPMPTALAHMEAQRLMLVEWDVGGTHPSFGQLLMLGRAAHCLHSLERATEGHAAPDQVMLSVRCVAPDILKLWVRALLLSAHCLHAPSAL